MYLYIYLFIMSIYVSIYHVYLTIHLSIYHVYISFYLFIYASIYPSIFLSIYFYLAIYLFHLSIYQSNTGTINNSDNDLLTVSGAETGLVEETLDYRFYLYRHWSLYESMYHSSYIAAKLGVWSHVGMREDDR